MEPVCPVYNIVIVLLIIGISSSLNKIEDTGAMKCEQGNFMDKITNKCRPCPDGTFMNLKEHSQTQCNICTKIKSPELEKVMEQCKKTQDTDIECIEGYYRELMFSPRCRKCKDCPDGKYRVPVSCRKNLDSICCDDGQTASSKNGWKCAVSGDPIKRCHEGQYLDEKTKTCQACVTGFMNKTSHSEKRCYPFTQKIGQKLVCQGTLTSDARWEVVKGEERVESSHWDIGAFVFSFIAAFFSIIATVILGVSVCVGYRKFPELHRSNKDSQRFPLVQQNEDSENDLDRRSRSRVMNFKHKPSTET